MQDAEDWIRDLNYSADGFRLAVASNDCKIYIYATRDGYAKLSTISSHQSFVTHVDFCIDGNYLQSADGAHSLLFADAATGILIPSESMLPICQVGGSDTLVGCLKGGMFTTQHLRHEKGVTSQ